MKKAVKENFTKLTHRGISLIVLIVTIIVIIIIAAAVIFTISKNNPVDISKEARFKENIRNFQDELTLAISKDYTSIEGQRDNKFNGVTFDEIKNYIPSFTKEYEGKVVIKNDELMYEEVVTEKESKWFEDLGVKLNGKTATDVAKEPKKYYGSKVTNYESNGVSDWKIFFSDEKNIYLITSEYVDVDKLPTTASGKKPENTKTAYPKGAPFTNILGDYEAGSATVTDERIKALNNDYFNEKKYESSYINMKAVAYMLDIGIWKIFAEGKGADYAIGGPTLEMLMASYSQKYDVDYKAQATSNIGYQISNDGGVNWDNSYQSMLNTSDSLYTLPHTYIELESGNKSGANMMWVASPSAGSNIRVIYVHYHGYVGSNEYYGISYAGFRPIVCLNSNVMLKSVTDGYEIQ